MQKKKLQTNGKKKSKLQKGKKNLEVLTKDHITDIDDLKINFNTNGFGFSTFISDYITLRNSNVLTLPNNRYLDTFKMKLGPGSSGLIVNSALI